jgi:ribosomal protein S10
MEIKTNAKIRVRLESFDHELLVSSCQKIINILQNTPLNSIGVVTLPTRKRIYCVYVHLMLIKIQENILKFEFINEF